MRRPSIRIALSLAAAAGFALLFAGSGDSSSTAEVEGDLRGSAVRADVEPPAVDAADSMYGAIPADSLYGQMLTAPQADSLYGQAIDADPGLYGSPPVQ